MGCGASTSSSHSHRTRRSDESASQFRTKASPSISGTSIGPPPTGSGISRIFDAKDLKFDLDPFSGEPRAISVDPQSEMRKRDMNFSVLLVGGTGLIGREVVRMCLSNNWRVRVATRNRKSDFNKVLARMGAEVFEVNFHNRASMVSAASMLDAAVFVTPFLETDPSSSLMWISALAAAATVARLILVTSSYNFKSSTLLSTFESTLVSEIAKKASSFQRGWAQVRSPLVMQGLLKFWGGQIVTSRVHRHPFGDTAFSWIDARDVAAVVSTLLIPHAHSHTKTEVVQLGGSEPCTHVQVADMISKLVGTPITVENLSPSDWADKLGPKKREGCFELLQDINDDPEQYQQVDVNVFANLIAGAKLRTLAAYLEEEFTTEIFQQDVRSFV